MRTMRWAWRIAGILILAVGFGAAPSGAQQGRIRIVSPAVGTVVRPGQTLTISVAADSSVEKLAMLGQRPLGVGVVVSGGAPGVVARGEGEFRPIQFQVKIPVDIRPGTYRVTAMGTVSGGDLLSDAVTLDVERAEEPGRIWAEPSMIQFARAGDRIPLRVLGGFADGSQDELTKSSKTTYVTGDSRVATVSADGMVTAVGPGKTSIQIRSSERDYSIPVRVE